MNKLLFSLLFVGSLIFVSSTNYDSEEENQSMSAMFRRFQRICVNATGDSEYLAKIEDGVERLMMCLNTLINKTEIAIEINELLPLGQANEVFRKTCKKQNAILQCFDDVATIYDACLTEQQVLDKVMLLKVIKTGMENICEKEDDVIAVLSYVNENGTICSEERKNAVHECFLSTFSKYGPRNPFIPSTFVNPDTCGDLKQFQKCGIPALNKCEEPVAGSLTNDLIDSVMNQLSCDHNDLNANSDNPL